MMQPSQLLLRNILSDDFITCSVSVSRIMLCTYLSTNRPQLWKYL